MTGKPLWSRNTVRQQSPMCRVRAVKGRRLLRSMSQTSSVIHRKDFFSASVSSDNSPDLSVSCTGTGPNQIAFRTNPLRRLRQTAETNDAESQPAAFPPATCRCAKFSPRRRPGAPSRRNARRARHRWTTPRRRRRPRQRRESRKVFRAAGDCPASRRRAYGRS